jgi:MoxR-like ATPase
MVLATQNPIEYEGTFPLPEAQMDRFLARISIGYPSPVKEVELINLQQIVHPLENLECVATEKDLIEAQVAVRHMKVSDELKRYIVDLVNATRGHGEIYLGASPRGSLALFRMSQAKAALAGRSYVVPDDIKAMAESALAHRLIVGSAARIREVDAREVVREIIGTVPVPGGELG